MTEPTPLAERTRTISSDGGSSKPPVFAEHAGVTGPTGGGKTTLLRQMADLFSGRTVLLTVKDDEELAGASDTMLIPQSDYARDLPRVRRWAKATPGKVQIIVDEAHNAPTFIDGNGAIKAGLAEDRSDGVKWVIATQSPQSLHTRESRYAPVQNLRYLIWVGEKMLPHRHFMNAWGLNEVDFPTEPFQYIVIRPTDPPTVWGPFKTDSRYA